MKGVNSNDYTDINEAINGPVPTLLEFYAPRCPHCQRMMPVVEELKKLYDGRELWRATGEKTAVEFENVFDRFVL